MKSAHARTPFENDRLAERGKPEYRNNYFKSLDAGGHLHLAAEAASAGCSLLLLKLTRIQFIPLTRRDSSQWKESRYIPSIGTYFFYHFTFSLTTAMEIASSRYDIALIRPMRK